MRSTSLGILNVTAALTGLNTSGAGILGVAFFGLQSFTANAKIKKYDKTAQAKFVQPKVKGDE